MDGVRQRTTKQQKRYKRSATASDYVKMVTAASAVVIEHRGRGQYRDGNIAHVLFEFPHWCKFPVDFPKGHIVSKTLLTNTYKINAVKLLDWLYNSGHAPYDAKGLVKQTKQFEVLDKSIDKMLEF